MAAERPERGDFEQLRQRAEELLCRRGANHQAVGEVRLHGLLDELAVHQVELELQNEELAASHAHLQEAHDRYRALYDAAPVGYVTLDAHNVVRDANPVAAQLLGVGREQLVGAPLTRFMAAEAQDALYLHHRRVRAAGQAETVELASRGGDGSAGHLELTTSPMATGKPEGATLGVILQDITHRRKVAQQTAAYREALRSLAHALSSTEERERRRIAGELHDRVNQNLAVVQMRLDTLAADLEGRQTQEEVRQIRELTRQVDDDVRTLSFELSPPVLYQVGLHAAMEWLGERLRQEHGLRVTVVADSWQPLQDEETRALLYRCVRELLLNVVKHAGTVHAGVALEQTGSDVVIEVTDGGTGFEVDEQSPGMGFGLFSIRERIAFLGGACSIESARGQGTRVRLELPLPGLSPDADGTGMPPP